MRRVACAMRSLQPINRQSWQHSYAHDARRASYRGRHRPAAEPPLLATEGATPASLPSFAFASSCASSPQRTGALFLLRALYAPGSPTS